MCAQEVLEMLTTMVEDKDMYTAGHSKRVAMYSSRIAEALGLSEQDQTDIYQAGLLHDIGKILTPEAILLKPRKLNRQEYAIMKKHPEDSEKMVLFISSFKVYAKIIRHHHERYDGEGYPDGLKGEEIPLLARIMSIADAFDAMTTNRIYKVRKTFDQAMVELVRGSGTQLDPNILPTAMTALTTFKDLVVQMQKPTNAIDDERFAFHFKDSLTSVYSGEYLNFFLKTNPQEKHFRCCYFIQLHHMSGYNERYGWKCGDDLLKEIALRIRVLFHSQHIFRVFGDDFVVLNSLHVSIETAEVLYKLSVGFEGIKISLQHFDFEENTHIDTWDSLENYLIHHEHV